LNLEPLVKRGLLRFHAARPTLYGLEMHLATMFKEIAAFQPQVVIVDPITSLMNAGTDSETKAMVTRLIDYLKGGQVTSLFTSLTRGGQALQQSELATSSLMDSWLLLQDFEGNGERNRVLYVIKSRGMAHSNQVREFVISNRGIDLVDTYIGPSGVLTGASRVAQAAREKAEALTSQQEAARRKRELVRKRARLEQQIAALRSEYETEEAELRRLDEQAGTQTLMLTAERTELARLRQADATVPARTKRKSRSKNKP
jgi:circadian clock protein KaiC